MSDKKPRHRVCWECGRKLWGNKHVEMPISEVGDGQPRILHISCAEQNYPEDYKFYKKVSENIKKRLGVSSDTRTQN